MVEDALSRKEEETEGLFCVTSISKSNWVEEERMEWKQYQKACKVIQQLQEPTSALDKFVWKNGLLWYQDRLYLCNNSQIKQRVLLEFHTSPIGRHSRFLKNYHKIKDFF
jgi:hypothetical protein